VSTEPHQQASILTRITCLLLGHKRNDGLAVWEGDATTPAPDLCVCQRCGNLYAIKVKPRNHHLNKKL